MPRHVSIVVFRECDPSIIYGVFDTLWAAGMFMKTSPEAAVHAAESFAPSTGRWS